MTRLNSQSGGSGGSGITQLTGDVTAGPGSGSQVATIANSGVSAGSYTNTDLTVGADGRITAAANGSAGSASDLVLLEQHTASSSASLDFTTAITNAYDDYLIECVNLVPATDGVNLFLRMSTNGGSSYDSGANYGWSGHRWNPGGDSFDGASSGDTSIDLSGSKNVDSIDNNSTYGFSGSYRLLSPLSTSLHKAVWGQAAFVNNSASALAGVTVSGRYLSTTAVNAFQVLMSSGNIASGIVRVYGIAKSSGSGGSGITELTGDVTAGPGSGSQAASIANSGVSAGSYTNTDLTVGADGRITAAANGSSSSTPLPYLQYQEQQTQNTTSGTFSSGAWRTRVLNTEVQDTGGNGSLASNQITLAAGTYEVRASAPGYAVNRHQLRLQNVTDAATILVGLSTYSAVNTDSNATVAHLSGMFTIAAGKALELQHQCQTTAATRGFGVEANFTTEVYANIEFWRRS